MSTRRKSSTALPGVETARPASKYAVAGESTHPATLGGALVVGTQSRNNLSLPRTPLIGRDHEVATVQQLLLQEQVGLLTLTGPGGIGKTRLAMQVAANLLDHFVDGVYVVSLAPISDPHLVASAIAQPLGVREAPGRSVQESLQAYLRDKQLLLVLDNFEQILAAAPVVSALLTACPRLKVLVTSRATLHLYGEQEFPVPPLALPILDLGFRILDSDASAADQSKIENPKSKIDTTNLSDFAAIDLFCQRARAVKPDFVLTSANASDIAKICIGLDGLPLALELAAARIKLFSPAALLARLNQRLTLLTDGPHDLPARQRTLRDEIAWSYDLLSADEQKLFRRLAVFVGGFTLEAAQAVGNSGSDLGIDGLAGVATLVDHNLVNQVEQGNGEARFGMLETIHQYAYEQLEKTQEISAARDRHLTYFLQLAKQAEPEFRRGGQLIWLQHLKTEYPNLRAALMWGLANEPADIPRMFSAAELAGALTRYWLLCGDYVEGRHWLQAAAQVFEAYEKMSEEQRVAQATHLRAKALHGAGWLAWQHGKFDDAQSLLNSAAELWRKVDDHNALFRTQMFQAELLVQQGNLMTAHQLWDECLAHFRQTQDTSGIAETLSLLGIAERVLGNLVIARRYLEESAQLLRTLGEHWLLNIVSGQLGLIALTQGDYAAAQTYADQRLAYGQAWNFKQDIIAARNLSARIAYRQSDFQRAALLACEALHVAHQAGLAVAESLMGGNTLTLIALGGAQNGQSEWAVKLLGARQRYTSTNTFGISAIEKSLYEQLMTKLHACLDEATFATAWIEGYALSTEQTIEVALTKPLTPETTSVTYENRTSIVLLPKYSLTAREVEVLRLLVQGLTYAQIADKLVVSRRTVNAHATSIYSKLGVTSRAMATRLAIEQRLV